MRIGVDATCWQNERGYGRHARALLSSMVRIDPENQYAFFMDSAEKQTAVPGGAEIRLVSSATPTTVAASSEGHRSLVDMWRMSRSLSDPSFDVLVFPTVYSFVPVFSRARKVVMIHDVIAESFPTLTLPSRAARLLWKIKVALGRWQADAIVTVSNYSRDRILRRFKIQPECVFVVGEASDPVFRVLEDPVLTPRLASLGLTHHGRMIVYVGGFSPHKNLESLVAAFGRIVVQKSYSDLHLVMVGEHENEAFHSHYAAIEEQVDRLGIGDRVTFTGYLPDEELVILLNLSTVLVLPSLMEGFGLPAIEAAACGCPVIATAESPLPFLLGEGGLYFEPTKRQELEKHLMNVLNSETLRLKMRHAGLAAAGRLTWDEAARQMINVIEKVVPQ